MPILAVAVAACGPQLPDPVPVSDPGPLERRLRELATPDEPKLIEFEWRYWGREGRFSGEGGVRVNPPDSVRLDLLGPGWSGVQSAVMLGADVYYLGEQRITLPPPTFMWTMIGAFRPPAGVEPQAARRGERSELTYQLTPRAAVAFHFDGEGRLIEGELRVDGDVVQEIRVEPGSAGDGPGAYRWPREARYRDLRDFHEVRIKVVEIREHEPFERRIFDVAVR
ncbi:MAG: hypothetical protein JSW46_14720 [Gemmatimonadota bacterium]|nr:MAG: hypothetical protein JSW46_14720 [Gemmatimonadota bacterium]